MPYIVHLNHDIDLALLHDAGYCPAVQRPGTRSQDGTSVWSQQLDRFEDASDFAVTLDLTLRICPCWFTKPCPDCSAEMRTIDIKPPSLNALVLCRDCGHTEELRCTGPH